MRIATSNEGAFLAGARVPLAPDEVHVVRVPLVATAAELAAAHAVLPPEERAKAARFYFEPDRRRYAVAHAALRRVLARCLGEPAPASLPLGAGPKGKPFLLPEGHPLRFNLSHSGELALIAIAAGREVGVDVEHHRPDVDFLGIALHSFSKVERAVLSALPPAAVQAGFYRCWSSKESFIKARGDGLSFPLDGFDVELSPDRPAALLGVSAAPADLDRWELGALEIDAGYSAALTVEGRGWTLHRWATP